MTALDVLSDSAVCMCSCSCVFIVVRSVFVAVY